MATDVALRGQQLVKTFGTGPAVVRAVDGVSLEVNAGELVLIKGPSGSGKTTLLSMLGGLMSPTSGHIHLGIQELTALDQRALAHMRAERIGFVFQAYNLLSALTAEENILFPARLLGGTHMDRAKGRARDLLERFGLQARRAARPAELSGGEKQRVAVARALINQPSVILADEPTGNLDSQRGMEVAMILHDIARNDGRAVVIVTHDPRIEDIADRVLWLEDGALRDRKREPHEWARDPICGMRVDRWTAVSRAAHAGTEYVFCSERCRQQFERDPERYSASPGR